MAKPLLKKQRKKTIKRKRMKNFLTKEEVNELKSQHRTEKNRKICDKIKAVLASNDGWSYKEIAEVLLLDKETISRHVRQ